MNIETLWDNNNNSNEDNNEDNNNNNNIKMTHKTAWANLCNCAVGSGILSIPFAFAQMGILLSIISYSIVCICSWIGLYLLARCTMLLVQLSPKTQDLPHSYEDIVERILGFKISIIFKVIVLIYCFSVLVGYLIIIADLIPPVLRWFKVFGIDWIESYDTKSLALLVICLSFIFPFSILQTSKLVREFSLVAIACIIYFVSLIIFESSINPFEGVEHLPCWKHDHDIQLFNNYNTLLIGTPILCFAFGGHLQSVSLYSDLILRNEYEEIAYESRRVLHSWSITTVLAIMFLTFIYIIVGIVSYICMILPGRKPYGIDILQHMIDSDPYDGFIQSASVSIGIALILSYPSYIFPLKNIFDDIITTISPKFLEFNQNHRYYIETFILIIASYCVAITIGNVKVVFGLIASSGSLLLQFIFPSILYLILRQNYQLEEYSKTLLFWSILLFIIGCLIAIAAIINIIRYSSTYY